MKKTNDDPKGFIERVEAAREKAGLGRYAFSTAINKGEPYWSVWITRHKERGGFPAGDVMAAMADVLNVSMDYLLGKEDKPSESEPLPEIQTVPLAVLLQRIGATPYRGRAVEGIAASAGSGASAQIPEGFDDARPRGKRRNSYDPMQDVEITGDCMVDLLYPGDVVTVDTRQMPQIGDVVVAVRFHDEMIVKFLRMKGDHQYLESKDTKKIIPLDQSIRIVGPVTVVQKSMRRLLAGL